MNIKKIKNSLYSFFTPLFSVWGIIIYMRVFHYLNIKKLLPVFVIAMFFIPIIIFELYASRYFRNDKTTNLWPDARKEKIFLFFRIYFWGTMYLTWVIIVGGDAFDPNYIEFLSFSVIPMFGMVFAAEGYISIIAVLLWLVSYYYVTIKFRKLRLICSLYIPALIIGLLFHHFYFLGGIGNFSRKTIEDQYGVELFYGPDDFPMIDEDAYNSWVYTDRFHPRDIYIDDNINALFANYADTYGDSSGVETVNILKIDLNTKETKYFISNFARAINAAGPEVIVSPWFDKKIYLLDKRDLSVRKSYPIDIPVEYWEVLDIFHDINKGHLYFTNDLKAGIFKYDYFTGELLNSRFFDKVNYGGAVWNIQYSKKRNKLYLTGFGSKEDIFEIDPDTLQIVRSLDLHTFGGSTLKLDDENDTLYFQDGGFNRLFEIDVNTLKLRRKIQGVVHARKIHIDHERNVLYVLSFYYGKLYIIDLKSGKRMRSIKVGGKAYGLAFVDDNLFINSRAGIVKIDLKKIWTEDVPAE